MRIRLGHCVLAEVLRIEMPIRKRSMSLDESRLIVRAKEGDANAFAALLRQHQEMALRVAFQIVGDWDDAEDVCQESFIKVYRHLGRYRARHKFSTWLYRIVTHTAIDLLRRQQRTQRTELPDDVPVASREEATDWQLSLEKVLSELTPKQRSAFVLRDLQGFPLEEVAEILDCSGITARVHLHQARKRLRQRLESER